MCNEHAHQSPEDSSLTSDLTRIETLLAKRTVPASQIDRDDLLYRAGWTAAEAQLCDTPRETASRQTSHINIAWRQIGIASLASAALAASLAVGISLQFLSARIPAVVVNRELIEEPQPIDVRVEDDAPTALATPIVVPVSANRSAETIWESKAPLLIMRDRVLAGWSDEKWISTGTRRGTHLPPSTELRSPKTSREILSELLPQV